MIKKNNLNSKNIIKKNTVDNSNELSNYFIDDDDIYDLLTPELINVDNTKLNNINKKNNSIKKKNIKNKINNKNDKNDKDKNGKNCKNDKDNKEIVIEITIDSIKDENDLDFIDDDFEYIEEDSDSNSE